MPTCVLLLRCLLVAAFCLDASVAQWRSAEMAGVQAQRGQAGIRSIAYGCDDNADSVHERKGDADCDCTPGCACMCVSPAASVDQAVVFAAQHVLDTHPSVMAVMHTVRTAISSVFRPPIG
ncbi:MULTISPECIES: CopL family metal-binding regulatory protein [Rhodanobacter]|nr:CopL family metal-binding regulatory protein [Rhodanobacter thiooxydans]UJJ56323.1 CopL family metal-binding regulatory protein [Rhodanobacter thiooxydans]